MEFNFQKARPFGMRNPYGVDDEFMVIRFSGRGTSGLVQYGSEFAMFSV